MFEEVSSINHAWRNSSTSKPSKLVTVTGCRESMGKWHHDMPQHSAIQRSPPLTRPWHPRRQSGSIPNRSLRRTHLSSAPRPRPGNRDRSRLASSSRALPFKSWSLTSRVHMTFNSDMWISLIQNLANRCRNRQLLTASTCSTTLLEQRWMMKLQDLQTIQTCHCQRMSKTYDIMTCRSIQRRALPSKPDHWNPENIWEQINMQIWNNCT